MVDTKHLISFLIVCLIIETGLANTFNEDHSGHYIIKRESSQYQRCHNRFYDVHTAGTYPDGGLKCLCVCSIGAPRSACCVARDINL